MERNKFLKNIALIGVGAMVAPKLLLAKPKEPKAIIMINGQKIGECKPFKYPTFDEKDMQKYMEDIKLKTIDYSDRCEQFLSEQVKGFKLVIETDSAPHEFLGYNEDMTDSYYKPGRITVVEKPELEIVFLQSKIFLDAGADVASDEQLKKFCDIINKATENGIIEYGYLCHVTGISLSRHYMNMETKKIEFNKYPARQILMFYPCSKYNTKHLRTLNHKYFTHEGEMTDHVI